ncbi:MAG: glycosyltransferase [Patescibacteria group bacterium]|jgi:glycosyltransferase involved in cell wall biosynthesis
MISFIIPVYNEEKVITETLQQFLVLTGIDYEIIVSDNGSTDTTRTLASQLGAKVVERPGAERTSIGECRNRGARVAQGNILWFIDADVRITNIMKTVSEVSAYFEKNSGTVAATMRIIIYPTESIWLDRVVWYLFNYFIWLQNRVLKVGTSAGDCMIIRRSAFTQLSGFRPELRSSEDFELYKRLGQLGQVNFFWYHTVAMSPRRYRRDGWPKVLWQWFKNWFTQVVFGKIAKTDWEARR